MTARKAPNDVRKTRGLPISKSEWDSVCEAATILGWPPTVTHRRLGVWGARYVTKGRTADAAVEAAAAQATGPPEAPS